MIFTAEEWAQVHAQAEAEYPAECCGVLLTRAEGPATRVLFPCRNAQDEMHAADPERYPRRARTAYFIAPKDLQAIGAREAQGYRIAVIYHSHIDAGAYFSATDRQNALIGEEPAYAETVYVVLSVVEGRVVDAGAFTWRPDQRDFVAVAFTPPPVPGAVPRGG